MEDFLFLAMDLKPFELFHIYLFIKLPVKEGRLDIESLDVPPFQGSSS